MSEKSSHTSPRRPVTPCALAAPAVFLDFFLPWRPHRASTNSSAAASPRPRPYRPVGRGVGQAGP